MDTVAPESSQKDKIKTIVGWFTVGCVLGCAIAYQYYGNYRNKEVANLRVANNQKRLRIQETNQHIEDARVLEEKKARRNDGIRKHNELLAAKIQQATPGYKQASDEMYARNSEMIALHQVNKRLERECEECRLAQVHNSVPVSDENKTDCAKQIRQPKPKAKQGEGGECAIS